MPKRKPTPLDRWLAKRPTGSAPASAPESESPVSTAELPVPPGEPFQPSEDNDSADLNTDSHVTADDMGADPRMDVMKNQEADHPPPAGVASASGPLSGCPPASLSKVTLEPPESDLKECVENHVPEKCHSSTVPPQNVNGRKYNFQTSWYTSFSWLHYEERIEKILCFICMKATKLGLHPINCVREETFISTGFNNRKKAIEKFKKHEARGYHKDSLSMLANQQKLPVDIQVKNSALKSQEEARQFLRVIFTSLMFLGKQGLAMRGDDKDDGNFMKLLYMRSQDVKGLSSWLERSKSFTSWAIQNEILQIVAHTMLRNIITKIKDAKFYSLIVDETSDVSVLEQVSINIRVVDNEMVPQEYFLGLYETSSTTAETLVKIILDVLQRFGLSLDNLRGQCYDGAANMSGRFKGVQAKLLEMQPMALYVHCYNHSLNLALQDSSRSIPFVRDVLSVVHEIGTIIRSSLKRMAQFNTLCASDENLSLKPRPLCPTRWTVRVKSIEAVLASYKNILELLEQIASSNDKAAVKAKGLQKQMETSDFFLGLIMAKKVFGPCERFSKELQSKSGTLTGSTEKASLLVMELQCMKTDESFNEMWRKTNEKRNEISLEEPKISRPRCAPIRIQSSYGPLRQFQSAKEKLRSVFFEFVEKICEEIMSRFDQTSINEFLKCEKTLVNYYKGDDCNSRDELLEVCSFYGWDADSMTSQLDSFRNIKGVKTGTTSEIITSFKTLSPEARAMLPELTKYIKHLLVLPSSSAEAERSFSMLRRIKSYLRSKMGQERLNHCCVISSYRDEVDDLCLDDMMIEFLSKGNRNLIFGHLSK